MIKFQCYVREIIFCIEIYYRHIIVNHALAFLIRHRPSESGAIVITLFQSRFCPGLHLTVIVVCWKITPFFNIVAYSSNIRIIRRTWWRDLAGIGTLPGAICRQVHAQVMHSEAVIGLLYTRIFRRSKNIVLYLKFVMALKWYKILSSPAHILKWTRKQYKRKALICIQWASTYIYIHTVRTILRYRRIT